MYVISLAARMTTTVDGGISRPIALTISLRLRNFSFHAVFYLKLQLDALLILISVAACKMDDDV